MENKSDRHSRLMKAIAHLPKKIVSLEGIEHAPAFVLHELCHDNCFGLSKAAFFADSPDFNSAKGIAGFDPSHASFNPDVMWQDPHNFINFLNQDAQFNQQVRQTITQSMFKNGELNPYAAQQLAQQLGFQNPAFKSWHMRHDNYGFLVYEYQGEPLDEAVQDQLNNSLYLLNFCPLI